MSISSCVSRSLSIVAGFAFIAASGLGVAAESRVVKGEVVSVNLQNNTAVIHSEKRGDTFSVKLPSTVVLAGVPTSATALKKGHLVTLKFAANQ